MSKKDKTAKKELSPLFIKPKSNLKAIKPYVPGKSLESIKEERGLDNLIKLASNENPLGPAIDVETLSTLPLEQYPDTVASPLFAKLCNRLDINANQLIIGNGSDEILQLIALAYLDQNSALLTSEVSFSEYSFIAHLMGASIHYAKINANTYDMNALEALFKQEHEDPIKVICIANPNNPTGTSITHQEIENLLQVVDGRALVVLDEAYAEYVTDPNYPDAKALLERYPNLIVLRTFSKIYGLAGYRIGYGFGSAEVIAALNQVKQPFNVNSLALKAAELALDNEAFVKRSLKLNEAGKQQLCQTFDDWGLIYERGEANFVYVELPKGFLAKEVMQALIDEGVVIRSLHGFGREHAIRVTVGDRAQNELFLKGLKKLCRL